MTTLAAYCPICLFVTTATTRCPQHPRQELVAPHETTADEWIGKTILPASPGQRGRYQILALLGVGGMGATYLAWQIDVERSVALKIMRTDRAPAFWHFAVASAKNDAAIPAKLPTSSNIVVVHEAGSFDGGRRYLVLEHLRGHDFAAFAESGISAELAVELVVQACRGFEDVHRAGIVHRDVKLENLYLHDPSPPAAPGTEDLIVKIIDFGIACPIMSPQLIPAGTGDYMAPEQFFPNAQLDERADIYGLGVSLYRLLTGLFPFVPVAEVGGGGFAPYVAAHVTQTPRSPSRIRPDVAISSSLDDVVMCSISRSRNERFSTMHDFRAALMATREASESAINLDRILVAGLTASTDLPLVTFVYPAEEPWVPPGVRAIQVGFSSGRHVIVDRYKFNMYVDDELTTMFPVEHRSKEYAIRICQRQGAESFSAELYGGILGEGGVAFDLKNFGRFRAGPAFVDRLMVILPSSYKGVIFVCV